MSTLRFGNVAREKGFIDKKQFFTAMSTQLSQEWGRGKLRPLGQILVDDEAMTEQQRNDVVGSLAMEPRINWEPETDFAKKLEWQKVAKQAIGEFVGREFARNAHNATLFLGHSSSVYYAFRGLVKHSAQVSIITSNAAILAAYPAVKSSIKKVVTAWRGEVNVDTAMLEPHDRNDSKTMGVLEAELAKALAGAFISASGVDANLGPMALDGTARVVATKVMQSQTPTYILIDPSKARLNTERFHKRELLFQEQEEWRDIQNRKRVRVVTVCHRDLPQAQANLSVGLRSSTEIGKILAASKNGDGNRYSPQKIKEVQDYCEWAKRMQETLDELPYPQP